MLFHNVSKQFLFFDVLIQIMLCNASKQIVLQLSITTNSTFTIFSDETAHLEYFNFFKNRKCALQCSAPNVLIWLCFLTLNQFYVVNGAIYLIASNSSNTSTAHV